MVFLLLKNPVSIEQIYAEQRPMSTLAAIKRRELVTKDDFAFAIAERWQDSVVAIIDVGKLLLGAKATLSHGEFEPMIRDRLPFGESTAQRLMAIANHSILSKAAHVQLLPPSWGTVYELTKIPDEPLQLMLCDGTIHPDIQRSEVVKLRRLLLRAENDDPGPIEGKYRVFYADPPWRYSDSGPIGSSDNYGRAERHYLTLSLEELCGTEDLPNGRNLAADIKAAAAQHEVEAVAK